MTFTLPDIVSMQPQMPFHPKDTFAFTYQGTMITKRPIEMAAEIVQVQENPLRNRIQTALKN